MTLLERAINFEQNSKSTPKIFHKSFFKEHALALRTPYHRALHNKRKKEKVLTLHVIRYLT